MPPLKNDGPSTPYLVFQMAVRMAACRELASDISTLEKLQDYLILDQSAIPTSLFPWLPSSVTHAKHNSTKVLFTIELAMRETIRITFNTTLYATISLL